MNSPLISIIVIGRNEAKNLRRLTASLAPLQDRWTSETIFVDSASSDDSVAVARALFDTTAVLAESPRLNASAGRFAGVLLAHGEWALFLDGDMEFTPQCLPQLAAHLEREPRDCGALGTYVHRYTSGAVRRWTATVDRHQRVAHFGGAVLLPMAALRQENWDPRIYSNEEIELYTRLRSKGFGVRRLDIDFINHWTDHVSVLDRFVGNFHPRGSFSGKKFYGAGQVLCARIADRRLGSLVRWFPDPFVLWLGIILAPMIAAFGGWAPAIAELAGVSACLMWRRRSWKIIIAYLAFLPQAMYGRRHFDATWTPSIAQVYRGRLPEQH